MSQGRWSEIWFLCLGIAMQHLERCVCKFKQHDFPYFPSSAISVFSPYKPKYFCLLGDRKSERSGAPAVGGKQHPCVESKLLVELDALPLEMQDSVLFKTKESEANLPDFSFPTFACVSMNHHYRKKCCQISKQREAWTQTDANQSQKGHSQ